MASRSLGHHPEWDARSVGPNGRGLCRWCLAEVSGRRRRWCGEECIDAYLVANSPRHAARRVLERDRGVCAECGLDCVAAHTRVRAASGGGQAVLDVPLSVVRAICHGRRAWEVDHVRPLHLADDGDRSVYALSNLQTLCRACHEVKSARETRARAQPPGQTDLDL